LKNDLSLVRSHEARWAYLGPPGVRIRTDGQRVSVAIGINVGADMRDFCSFGDAGGNGVGGNADVGISHGQRVGKEPGAGSGGLYICLPKRAILLIS
jgi:hypothetical protein